MIDRLIEFSARKRATVFALVLAAAVWGWWNIRHIPLDALPDLSEPKSSSTRIGIAALNSWKRK